MDKRMRKRRSNLLYRLRRKGYRCDTRGHVIYYPADDAGGGGNPMEIIQIARLKREFGFCVQYEIV